MNTREELSTELLTLHNEIVAVSVDVAMATKDRQRALKALYTDYIDILLEMHSHVVLSIDGNEGCALLGENLQEGLAFFQKLTPRRAGESKSHRGRRAAMQAYSQLLTKVGKTEKQLPFVWQTK